MTPELLVKRFQKYGAMVILFNGIVFSIIFAVSFPLLHDKRLLYSFILLFLLSFTGIFIYYMFTIKGIIRLISIDDNESKLKIRKTFGRAARLTMYANIIYLSMIYLPLFFLMYFKFGYTNLYYHFYVFSVSTLLFLFLGFNSMVVWYARTYPLGKMGIPVAVQRFRSKILSVVLPVILFASSILLMAFYFIQVNTVTEAIDKRIFDSFYFLNYISNESETSGTLIEGPLEEFSGIWIRLNPDRTIEYSNADYLKGKKAGNIIEQGNQPDYLYNAVLSLLDNNNISRGKTVGVFNGEKSVFLLTKALTAMFVIFSFLMNLNYTEEYTVQPFTQYLRLLLST